MSATTIANPARVLQGSTVAGPAPDLGLGIDLQAATGYARGASAGGSASTAGAAASTPSYSFTWTGAGNGTSWGYGKNWYAVTPGRYSYPVNGDTARFEIGAQIDDTGQASYIFVYSNLTIAGNVTSTQFFEDNGQVAVTGQMTASAGKNATALTIGSGTPASLTVEGGGSLNISNSGTTNTPLAVGVGSTGTLTVTGGNSKASANNGIDIGFSGTGYLNVLNGGSFSVATQYPTVEAAVGIGGPAAGGIGYVTVSGAGSVLTAGAGGLGVGDPGRGTLVISQGGQLVLSGSNLFIANAAKAQGTVTVTDPGSTITIGGALNVGNYGIANLTVKNQGSVAVTGTAGIGRQAGAVATATVTSGAGVTIGGNATIGNAGMATVTVSGINSNLQVGGNVYVGQSAKGTGTITVASGGKVGVGGNLTVGGYGHAFMTVMPGSYLSTHDAIVAFGTNSYGTLVLYGSGTKLNTNGSELGVGLSATGKMFVAQNAQATAGEAFIGGTPQDGSAAGNGQLQILSGGTLMSTDGFIGGAATGANGQVTVSGAGSLWTLGSGQGAGPVTIGESSTGSLYIGAGGTVNAGYIKLGDQPGSKGQLTVGGTAGGAPAILTASGNVVVGNSAAGAALIQNAAQVTVTGTTTIGAYLNRSGAGGDLTVEGALASWQNAGAMIVGGAGAGLLTVNGGQVSVNNGNGVTVGASAEAHGLAVGAVLIENQGTLTGTGIDLGMVQGAFGDALVTGNQSTWNDIGGGNLTVGDHGYGALTIANGGTVAVSGSIDIGITGVSGGHVTLSGVGSVLTGQQDPITIGDGGDGEFYIVHGAQFTAASEDVVAGNKSGATGVLLVDGAGSEVTIGGTLTLGQNGNGVLLASYGVALQVSANLDAAAKAGSEAAAFLFGQGMTGTVGGDLNVGVSGVANFSLNDGAALYVTGAITVGESTSGRGWIGVDGVGAKLVSGSGAVTIGGGGHGVVSVQNGALFDASSSDVTVGDQQGSSGYLEIDGNGTQFDAASLTVSADSTGKLQPADDGMQDAAPDTGLQFQLDLSAGALLSISGDMTVGEDAGSSGNVSVTDTGSALEVGGDLVVGEGGKGLLTFDGGGAVVNGDATFGAERGASGKLTVATANVKVNGTLTLGEGGSGAATVNLGGALDASTIDLAETPGSSGKLTIDGAGTTVEAGMLSVGPGAGSVGLTNGADLQTMSDVSVGETVNTNSDKISLNEESSWSDGGGLTVGEATTGAVSAQAGSKITVAGDLVLAAQKDATGSVTITGTGQIGASSLLYGGALVIGDEGGGSFTVSSGGAVGPASGASGTVEIAASAGAGNLVVTGAKSQFTAGALVVGGTGAAAGGKGSVTVASGGAVTASSLMLWGGDKAVVTDGTLDDSGALSGTGAITIGAQGVVTIGGSAAGGTITFAAGTGTLDLSDPASVATVIKGFQTGDTINLAGVTVDGDSFGGNKLTLTDGGTPVATLAISGPYKTGEFSLTPSANGVALTVAFTPTKSDPPKTIATAYASGVALTAYNYYNPLSIASAGAITASGGNAVYGDASQAWTVVNSGTVAATGGIVGDNGVYLAAGGKVTNNAAASIAGYGGVYVTGGPGTVANSGTIAATGTGAVAFGVYLGAGGYVDNTARGTVAGGMTGVALGAYGTVVNEGTITAGPNGRGVVLAAGGVLANLAGGAVSGYGAVALGAPGSVANSGTIAALGSLGVGVSLEAGGTLANAAGAAVTGYTAVYAGGAATIVNQGVIAGSGRGIYLGAGGLLSNGTAAGSAASVTGYEYGIVAAGAPAMVTNYGTVTASGSSGVGVVLDPGSTLVNAGAITGAGGTAVALAGGDSLVVEPGARFTGAIAGFAGGDTIVLPGVDATGYGYADGMLTLDNGAAAVARLALTTVYAHPRFILAYQGGTTTVAVAAALHAVTLSGDHPDGITLGAQDAYSPLTITGTVGDTSGAAVYGNGYAAWTVTNAGTVIANPAGIGIELSFGGLVTNGGSAAPGAYTAGYTAGIEIAGTRGTIVNAGTVAATGTAGIGVELRFGGALVNEAGGAVSGAYGVEIGDDGTVTNSGTIAGAIAAVQFGVGSETLVVEPGSVLSGAVAGLMAGDTLDFAHESGDAVSFASGTLSLLDGSTVVGAVALSGTFSSDEFTLGSDNAGGTDVGVTTLPPPGDELSGDGESDALMTFSNGALVLDEISGGQMGYAEIGALGPEWQFEGSGPIAGDGRDQFLLWYGTNDNPIYGSLVLAEDDGGSASYSLVGAIGPEWQFEGVGALAGGSNSDILLWYGTDDSPIYGALVVGADEGGSLAYTDIGAIGPEWQFEGVGDYLNNGSTDFLIWDTSSSSPIYGSLVVGEDVGGSAQYTLLGGLGPSTWQFEGSGDLLGDGKESFLLWDGNSSDSNYGALVVGEVNGGAVGYTEVGAVGPQWQFLGVGDYDGASPAEFLMLNSQTGVLVLGKIADGAASYTAVGGLNPSQWTFHATTPALLA